jgi:hypothetical protein
MTSRIEGQQGQREFAALQLPREAVRMTLK